MPIAIAESHWDAVPRLDVPPEAGCLAQALADADGSNGAVIRLFAGEYEIDRTLRLPNNLKLVGTGPETVIRLKRHANCHMFVMAEADKGAENLYIADLLIDGQMDYQSKPEELKALTFACGFYFRNCANIELRNVKAKDIRQTAVHLNTCRNVTIDGLCAERVGWSGLSSSEATDVSAQGTVIDSGLDHMHSAIHMDGGTGVILDFTVRRATGNAIMLDSAFSPMAMVVVKGDVSGCKRGVSFSGTGTRELRNAFVSGHFHDNNEVGVMISNAVNVVVAHSVIANNKHVGLLFQGRSGGNECIVVDTRFDGNGVDVEERHHSRNNLLEEGSLILTTKKFRSRFDVKTAGERRSRFAFPAVHTEKTLGGDADPTGRSEKEPGSTTAAEVPNAAPMAMQPSRLPGVTSNSQLDSRRRDAQESAAGNSQTVNEPGHGAPQQALYGLCNTCGEEVVFQDTHKAVRESFRCSNCKASARHRAQADAVLRCYNRGRVRSLRELTRASWFAALDVFEPGLVGPNRQYFKRLKGYVQSYYWPELPLGAERDGVRNEGLMSLTFEDESLDLIITSDILEHVRRPWVALAEIARVLRPGGRHVFSIPVLEPMRVETHYRVDTRGDEDLLVDAPHYHTAGDGGRSLVYTEFGADLFDRLAQMGTPTTTTRISDADVRLARLVTFISTKCAVDGRLVHSER